MGPPREADLAERYDVRETVEYILSGGYRSVALQFPDDLLADSPAVSQLLQQRLGDRARVFILADTAYNPLGVDEVAAQHLAAQCVIHYGRASLVPVHSMPAFFVLPKDSLDAAAAAAALAPAVNAAVQERAAAAAAASTSGGGNGGDAGSGGGGFRAVVVLLDQCYQHRLLELRRALAAEGLGAGPDNGEGAAAGAEAGCRPPVVFATVPTRSLRPAAPRATPKPAPAAGRAPTTGPATASSASPAAASPSPRADGSGTGDSGAGSAAAAAGGGPGCCSGAGVPMAQRCCGVGATAAAEAPAASCGGRYEPAAGGAATGAGASCCGGGCGGGGGGSEAAESQQRGQPETQPQAQDLGRTPSPPASGNGVCPAEAGPAAGAGPSTSVAARSCPTCGSPDPSLGCGRAAPSTVAAPESAGTSGGGGGDVVRMAGLSWSLPAGAARGDCLYVWVGLEGSSAQQVLQLTHSACEWLSYDPAGAEAAGAATVRRGLSDDTRRLLKRRNFVVEKARAANILGLLVGTLGSAGFLDVIACLRRLAAAAGKKTYTFLMGKPNPAKLGNFPEVDVFVMVAESQGLLLDCRDYLAPLVTPWEAALAFAGRHLEPQRYRMELTDVLDFERELQEQQQQASEAGGAGSDSDSGSNGLALAALGGLSLATRGSGAACRAGGGGEVVVRSAAEYLAVKRTFRGLEMPATGAAPKAPELAVEGLSGRAAVYTDEGAHVAGGGPGAPPGTGTGAAEW